MIRQSGFSGNRRKLLSGLTACPSACARYASRTTSMHSARWARMMSSTVLPLMMDKSKCMAPPSSLLEVCRPGGIEDRIEVRRPAVRPTEPHRGALGLPPAHPRRISLDRREHRPAGAARKQAVDLQQLPARRSGLPLGYQDDVVNAGVRQQRRDDARPNTGNVAFAERVTENDGALGIDGNDPNFRVALLEPARQAGDCSPRADADEDIVQRGKISADLTRRELVVRLHGVRVAVLIRPVGVRDGVT